MWMMTPLPVAMPFSEVLPSSTCELIGGAHRGERGWWLSLGGIVHNGSAFPGTT